MADSNATDSATAAVGSRSEDQENQEDVPVVDCQGELSLRTKKFLFWSATKK